VRGTGCAHIERVAHKPSHEKRAEKRREAGSAPARRPRTSCADGTGATAKKMKLEKMPARFDPVIGPGLQDSQCVCAATCGRTRGNALASRKRPATASQRSADDQPHNRNVAVPEPEEHQYRPRRRAERRQQINSKDDAELVEKEMCDHYNQAPG